METITAQFFDLIVNPVDAFFITLFFCMILLVLLVIVLMFGYSPFTFVRAKFGKKILLFVANKDRFLDIVTGKSLGGVVQTKRYGDYAIIPQTTYILGNGVRAGLVFAPIGSTLSMDMVKDARDLQSVGVETYTQFEETEQSLLDEKKKVMAAIKDKGKELARPEILEYKNKLMAMDRVMYSMDNIKNFFKFNFNPFVIEEAISRATLEGLQDWKKFDVMKWVMAMIMLLMVFVIAYVIVMSVSGGGGVGGVGFLGGSVV